MLNLCRNTSQLTLLLVRLYEVLPCDVEIKPQCLGSLASQQAQLLKCLHQEVGAMKRQLNKTEGSPAEGASAIDFSGGVDAVRQQVDLQKERLMLKRKASDNQTVKVLSQTLTDCQEQTDRAAEQLVLKSGSS